MNTVRRYAKQNQSSLRLLRKSQQEAFPFVFRQYGLKITVFRNVFSPKHFTGWRFFHQHMFGYQHKVVLDMGCGTGIAALYFSKNGAKHVLAVDLNEYAVKNALYNVRRNSLKNIDVRKSNLFSNISRREKFDLIYWNHPFLQKRRSYQYSSILEMSLFDPGYEMLDQFLERAPGYLNPNGLILLGWGEYANTVRMHRMASKNGFLVETVAASELPEMRFELVSLKLDSKH